MSAPKSPGEVVWNKHIGEIIRNERIKRRLSLPELANRCGIARSSLFDMEHGRVNVRVLSIHKLSMEMPRLWHTIAEQIGRKRK